MAKPRRASSKLVLVAKLFLRAFKLELDELGMDEKRGKGNFGEGKTKRTNQHTV